MNDRIPGLALAPTEDLPAVAGDQLRILRWLTLCTIHDLNNYLTAVMGAAGLAWDRVGAFIPKELETIEMACLRSQDSLGNLRDFCEDRPAPPVLVDLNRMAREAFKVISPVAPAKVGFLLDLAAEATPVTGDRVALQSLLFNLLINALDAMPAGGTVTLRTRNEGPERVSLTIGDTGAGMSPEALAHATEAFFTTKPGRDGHGIGLARVRETVLAHQGTLRISSEKGFGTQVRIEFRRAATE